MPMTPEEFQMLQEVRDAVVEIKANCVPCRASLAATIKALFGPDGKNLATRVSLLENNIKWVRTQTILLVTIVISVVTLIVRAFL